MSYPLRRTSASGLKHPQPHRSGRPEDEATPPGRQGAVAARGEGEAMLAQQGDEDQLHLIKRQSGPDAATGAAAEGKEFARAVVAL